MTSSTAFVFYDNLLVTNGSLSASSTAAGHHVQNAVDGRTTTFWRSAGFGIQWFDASYSQAIWANAFGLFRHNIGSAATGTVWIEAWDDDFNARQVVFFRNGIFDNQCIYARFVPHFAKNWRVVFVDVTPNFFVGVCQLGWDLQLPYGMPVGFVPPRHNRNTEIINNRTESGQFAGRSIIQRGFNSNLIQNQVRPDWLRFHGEPFIRHAEKKPFFFSWSYNRYPDDAVYCIASDIAEQPYKDHGWQSFRMTLECLG